jgi:putative transposase
VGQASLPVGNEGGQAGTPVLLQSFMEEVYRRKLPHWRRDGATYFVTWRVAEEQGELDSAERELVVSALRAFEGQRYELDAWVVMNDHVHVIVRPMAEWSLKSIVHSWKSFTANRMQRGGRRTGRVWQDEYFDRIVRDEKELLQKYRYILGNPYKRWPLLNEYQWVWPKD